MKSFFLMLSFFTRIPLPNVEYQEARYIRGIKYVPLIGLLIGAILYAVSFFCAYLDRDVAAVIILGVYIMLTGALHIDGMADTCDGIFSGRDRDRILEIMRDSCTGVYGVISIAFFMIYYAILFRHIPYEALIIMPITGKSAPVISAYMANYIRTNGLGKVFADNCGKLALAVAILLPALVAALIDPFYLIAVFAALAAAVGITARLKRIIGGVTGDTMGFVCEMTQMVFVFIIYLIGVFR